MRSHRSRRKARVTLERLEERTLLTVTLSGVPNWVAAGPAPNTNGQDENIPAEVGGGPNAVSGAIEAIAVDPGNSNVVFVGGVNGGVWMTPNITANPVAWVPLTDQFSALEISSLQFDPTDASNQTIVAGIGNISNDFANLGPMTGLLKSTDGGGTWAQLGNAPLASGGLQGEVVSAVLPRGTTILVGVRASSPGGNVSSPSPGLFRSVDGGQTFQLISGLNNLGNGQVLDVASDPSDANRAYVVVGGATGGIFRTDDLGAHWTNVTNLAAITAQLTSGTFTNARLAVSAAATNPVYLAIADSGRLSGVFWSSNLGAMWTAMDLPQTNDADSAFGGQAAPQGINPGGQASANLTIAADPNNANLVYIAGDRQPDGGNAGFVSGGATVPNSIGAVNYSARIFRGNTLVAPTGAVPSPQWTPLTNSGTMNTGPGTGSSPHADSRALLIDSGKLLYSGDGGIFEETSPTTTTGNWLSLNGALTAASSGLQVTQFTSVISYDSRSNIIFGGAQDTGDPQQSGVGSMVYQDQTQGDGPFTAVDDLTATANFPATVASARYGFFNAVGPGNLGPGIGRQFYTAGNAPVGGVVGLIPPAGISGVPAFTALTVSTVAPSAGNSTRVVVFQGLGGNVANPGTALFLADNAGTAASAGAINYTQVLTGAGWGGVNVLNGSGSGNAGIFAITVGGLLNGVANQDVIYAGSGNQVFLRTAATGPGATLTATAALPAGAGTIQAVATDPNNWMIAYVTNGSNVYQTTDAGAHWATITGNLSDNNIHTVNVIDGTGVNAGVSAILVGETDGVFRELSNDPKVWTKFGPSFPNSSVWGVAYNSVSNGSLVAGTNGRGAFEVQNANNTLFSATILTITGDQDYSNEDDTVKLEREANNPTLLDVFLNSTTPVLTVPIASIQQINVNTLGGNDTLIVDSTNGLIDVPGGIRYDGGTGDNNLELLQTGGPTQTSDTYTVITNPGQGSDVIVGAITTQIQSVFFQNLAPVYDNVPAPLTVVGTPSNNVINYEKGPHSGILAAPYNGDATGLATVDNFEALEFSHKATLNLQGSNGDDTFVINNLSTPTGLTTINVSGELGNNTLVVDANSMAVSSSAVSSTQVNIPVATPIAVGYDNTIQQVSVIHALDTLKSTGAFIPNGVEGVPLNNVLVGTFQFTDVPPPPVFGNPADFTATINWGDGSASSAGTIIQTSPDAANQVLFQVFGTHTYAEENAPGTLYQISVTIHDKGSTRSFTPTGGVPAQIVDNPGASTSTPAAGSPGAAQAMVIDAPIIAQAAPIAAVEGQPLPVTTILATFMDTDPLGTTTDYTATVNWGDGTPTVSAMIAEPAGPGLPFDVSQAAILGHTYAEEGKYVTTIVISDAGGSKTIVNGAVDVADAPLTSAGLPTPPIIPEGTQFSGAVATFSDLDPAGTPSDYTATITWGDGITTLGTIVPGTPGLFNVLGTHTFEEGTYTVSVVIADAGGATTTAVSTFKITDAPLLVASIPPITEAQAQSFTAPIGAFTDADSLSTASDFSATINWGDGSAVTSGVISQQANGTYIVTGTHIYAANSTGLPPFMVTFSVKDIGGSTLVGAAGSPVTVLASPLSGTAGTTIKGTEGISTGTVLIGTFTDADPLAKAGDFTVILPPGGWGDGTPAAPTALTVTEISATTSNTVFAVTGSHIYAEAGQYPISVNVSDAGGASTVIASTALIADAPLAFPPQQPIRTTEAAIYPVPILAPPLFSGAVAYFTDANPTAPVSDFTAMIEWGDGTAATVGTVVPGPAGTFQVNGSHSYADSGVNGGTGIFTIQAFITDVDGSKLIVPNTALVADNPITLTGILNPASDSGKNNSDAITDVAQPNFYGTSAPFSTVTLSEAPIAGGPAVKIGQVEAGSDGSWSVNSSPLVNETYRITASAVDQFGETTTVAPVTIVPTLVVDTVAPVINNLSFDRLDGTLTVNYKDNLSGMDLASLTNSAFYHISATPLSSKVHPPKLILPTSISFTSDGVPTDPVVVKVVFNHGHSMRGGNYEVVIDSGTGDRGLEDVAGNALDGNYYGRFPTGDGLPGGDFVATIATFHNRVLAGVPIKDGYSPPTAGIDPPQGSSAARRRDAHPAIGVPAKGTTARRVSAAVHDAAMQALSSEKLLHTRKAHRTLTSGKLQAAATAARSHGRLVEDQIARRRRGPKHT
jgi:hypothetical protein